MAATYGYGGEFSSDEDIDRIEQQSERLVQSKFDSHAQVKPTRFQIEEAVETIKRLPLDQTDFNFTDELLAALLDHYKTQRGPIVDSTRNLYKKIVLRLIRGDQQQVINGEVTVDSNSSTNGKQQNNNSVILDNNNINSMNFKLKPFTGPAELGSSDEDEPMLPASQSSVSGGKKLDSRVVYNSNDRVEPMEVDSENPSSQLAARDGPRDNEMTSSSSSSSESSSEESSEESDSDSEALDMTPRKNQVPEQQKQSEVQTPAVPIQRKVVTSATAPNVLSAKANKEPVTDAKKKPYTRSQRVVATRSSLRQQSNENKKADVSLSKQVDAAASSNVKPLSKSVLKSKFRAKYLVIPVIVALFAFLLYHFRLDLTKSTDRVFKRAISF